MNFDTMDKLDVNYSHKRTNSKNSLLDFNENEYKPFKHSLSTGKLSMTDKKKYGHSRTGSKSSITNKLVGKRMGSFSRHIKNIKINDRGSSLPKNNPDAHTHIHKQSHGNLLIPSNNEFLIQTRDSSLKYSTSSSVITTNSSFNNSNNIAYSGSRDNLNYLYHYSKHSPTSSPRDVNKQYPIYRNNSAKIPASHYVKSNISNPYSPTSPTTHSPMRSLSTRDNHQKENYIKYNFGEAADSIKEKIVKSSLRNKSMKLWTPNDVLVWLSENNLDIFKENFKNKKIDGKALMEQNYETLIDIDVEFLDKYNIISKRNAVLQYEKKK